MPKHCREDPSYQHWSCKFERIPALHQQRIRQVFLKIASMWERYLQAAEGAKRKSEELAHRRIWCHFAAISLGIVSLAAPGRSVLPIVLAALLCELIALLLRVRSRGLHERHRRSRRAALLSNSFGVENVSTIETYDQLSDESQMIKSVANPYFGCKAAVGVERLMENLCESIFFSSHLIGIARNELLRKTLILMVALVAAAVLLPWMAEVGAISAPQSVMAEHVILSMIGFLVVADILQDILAFTAASDQLKALTIIIHAAGDTSLWRVLDWMAEYSVITSLAPPIPTAVYLKHRERLTKVWSEEAPYIRPADAAKVNRSER